MNPLSKTKPDRLTWLFIVFAVVFLSIIFRAAELQLANKDVLLRESKKTSERFSDQSLSPRRNF
ncbi:MAG: hypothetical protein LBI10_07950 [Deltaproteobacteria bacterium]|jgi:cell division protein FtsI/penicillin-binding protein 2|nr:hypothetical protein [Deltaproteobacteria bacterium]